jgi:hypothetical protein
MTLMAFVISKHDKMFDLAQWRSAELPLKVETRTCNFPAILAMWSG